jgi:urease accessory protein
VGCPELSNIASKFEGVQQMHVSRPNAVLVALALCLMVFALPALAHTEGGAAGGFISGVSHPISGWDHVIAMVAVGLWGAFLGAPAIWLLPVVFPLVMAGGGALGILGLPVPSVELGIALSAVSLGLCIALALRPPLWIAAIIVGAFAIFHGHAHGTELPGSANPFAYAAGFVIATGLLHVAGIALGLLATWPAGKIIVRTGGGLIALAGLAFLVRLA